MLHTYWKYPKHYWSGFEEESSVCSICSPIFLHTCTATFSISWAKSPDVDTNTEPSEEDVEEAEDGDDMDPFSEDEDEED